MLLKENLQVVGEIGDFYAQDFPHHQQQNFDESAIL